MRVQKDSNRVAISSSQVMTSFSTIDALPPGIGVEETRLLLEQNGFTTQVVGKDPKASHLSGFEVQFYLDGRKVTYGLTDYDSKKKKRVALDVHGYVRAAPTVLQKAVSTIKQLLAARKRPCH